MSGDPHAPPTVQLDDDAQVSPSGEGERRSMRRMLSAVEQRMFGEAATDPSPQPFGRYLVLGEVGAGAMGVVLRAYDPRLRREVALKRVKVRSAGRRDADADTRLLREARALASLNHPNVLAVYDVEEIDGAVLVAMELVEGERLDAWMRAPDRTWREVVDAMRQAARGLAAAHAAGLVHRDFKPANVIVGRDGRVRVMDFGLARWSGTTASGAQNVSGGDRLPAHSEISTAPSATRDEALTAAGSVVGTPAYMAPEQHAGGEVDARSDQYAMCVTMWEALWGSRPFVGDLDGLARAKAEGPPIPPTRPRMPSWLRRIVVRGLAAAPAQRFASMDALLTELDRGHRRARLGRAVAVLAIAATAVAGVAGARQLDRSRRIAACEAAGATIAEVWNEDTRTRVRAGLLASGLAYADSTAALVLPWLDEHAVGWQHARTEACLDAEVRATWSAELLERSLWCLDERRLEFSALVDELEHADAQVVPRAVRAAAALSRIEPCRDTERLQRQPVPPVDQRELAFAVQRELAHATALERAAKFDQGMEVAEAALVDARELAWPPLEAAARARVGALMDRRGRFEEAEAMLVEAYFDAARAGAAEVAFDTAVRLTVVVGEKRARAAEGLHWGRLAEIEEAKLWTREGLWTAARLSSVAAVQGAAGERAEARALWERVLGLKEEMLGPLHPSLAETLNNLANVRLNSGDQAEAQALFERALVISEQALGPDHPDVASALGNLGAARFDAGAWPEARALHERALRIKENALGVEHPSVATTLTNLANVALVTGEYADARALYGRTLGIMETALGPEHPDVASTLNNLAAVDLYSGSYADARTHYLRALAIREKVLSPAHPDTADSLTGLGLLELAERHPEAAVDPLTRALTIYEGAQTPAGLRAEARFALSRALWESRRDRERAIDLARRAADEYRQAGTAKADSLAEVERWLAERD